MNALVTGGEFLVLGAMLGADQTAGPQWMLGQPLVAGAVAGALTGQPLLGGMVGLWGQLTWNGAVPVGSRPHPDVSGGTLAGVLAASSLVPAESMVRAGAIGVLTSLAVGWLGLWLVFLNRRWNSRWTPWVLQAPDGRERLRRAGAAQGLAWWTTAALSGIWVLAGAAGGILLGPPLLHALPAQAGGAGGLNALLWGLGLGGAFLAFWRSARWDWLWLAGGAAAAAALKLARVY